MCGVPQGVPQLEPGALAAPGSLSCSVTIVLSPSGWSQLRHRCEGPGQTPSPFLGRGALEPSHLVTGSPSVYRVPTTTPYVPKLDYLERGGLTEVISLECSGGS